MFIWFHAANNLMIFLKQVSNELLHQAFAKFGQVVRAVVIVDDKGRSTNKGIVEFNRKITAQKTIQQINVNFLHQIYNLI